MSALPLDEVLMGDCREILPTFPEGQIDVIFADPPYNLQLRQELWRPNQTRVDAVDDAWDQFRSFEEYDAFTREWLSECHRVLKPDGTLWVIGTYHNIYRVGRILQDLGFWILNDVVWIKTNPMPNFRGVRLTNAHETLIWAARSERSRYTFNREVAKVFNDGKQLRSDWTLPLCTGAERLKVNGRKLHSTQKPEALLERVILISSRPGDIVLDPFLGTGTTAAVAKRLGRHWIGIEKEPIYVEAARRRVTAVTQETPLPLLRDADSHRAVSPRVSFHTLVIQGLLHPGQLLYFKRDRALAATITTDGRIAFGDVIGSIHQIGRLLSGGAPCNGWQHWYYERDHGVLQPIDELRKRYANTLSGPSGNRGAPR